ncbi:MAG: LytR/AlgR family response regulator transcription factor [Salibacteraceae bacterium]
MKKVRALIVDDEESARDELTNLVKSFCPELELLAACATVEEAAQFIRSEKPNLVFLDIEMPNYAGYELLDFFESIDFEIIFVTAYDSYAVKAFELCATDYLLKPVKIERLQAAVKKAQDRITLQNVVENYSLLKQTLASDKVEQIAVFDRGERIILQVNNILAIEAQESYSKIYTEERVVFVSRNLKHFEDLMDTIPHFLRTHKSWIVNLNKVDRFNKTVGEIFLKGGICAKLSKAKKPAFRSAFEK